jgi:hypothetical protein
MPTSSNSNQTSLLTRTAFFLSLVALVIPMCYAHYTIATPTYYLGPLYTEIRLAILILGIAGVSLGILALFRRTRSKVLAISAIILGLFVPIQHVIFCGSDALHQKLVLFCPMLWGIRIP